LGKDFLRQSEICSQELNPATKRSRQSVCHVRQLSGPDDYWSTAYKYQPISCADLLASILASATPHTPAASLTSSAVLHPGRNNPGDATTIATAFAREVATFRRFRLYRNPIPRGASSGVELVME